MSTTSALKQEPKEAIYFPIPPSQPVRNSGKKFSNAEKQNLSKKEKSSLAGNFFFTKNKFIQCIVNN